MLDSIEYALWKSFTMQVCREASTCHVVGGKVLSGQAALYMQMFSHMECASSWVDVTLGMSKPRGLSQVKRSRGKRCQVIIGAGAN